MPSITLNNRSRSMKHKRSAYQLLLIGYIGVAIMLIILALP